MLLIDCFLILWAFNLFGFGLLVRCRRRDLCIFTSTIYVESVPESTWDSSESSFSSMWFVDHLISFYYSDDSNAYVYSIVIVSLDDKRRRFPLFYSRLVINKERSWEVKFVGILGESACWALLAGSLELWHGYRHPWRIRARFTRVGRMSYANHECTLVYSY